MTKPLRWTLALLAAAIALPAGAYLWAKAEYYPAEAVDRAQAFINLLHAGQFDHAQDLALRNEYVGRTPAEFSELMFRQLCDVDHVAWTAPPQTNGNRLRRWFNGVEVEMPEITVEFEGRCLVSVHLRRAADGQWKVFNMQRHAG